VSPSPLSVVTRCSLIKHKKILTEAGQGTMSKGWLFVGLMGRWFGWILVVWDWNQV
jgi:hypothetical protein